MCFSYFLPVQAAAGSVVVMVVVVGRWCGFLPGFALADVASAGPWVWHLETFVFLLGVLITVGNL